MSLAFFTIATRGFLPRARVLADAVLRQHPQARFYVLIADRPQPEDAESTRGLECLYATELDLPYAEHFFFRYEAFELCTALKPYGLLWLLRHTDAAQLIYLDADIHVLAPFTPVLRLLDEGAAVVLTPHLCAPLDGGGRPNELDILHAGAYNVGFVAVARAGAPFAQWWARRLEHMAHFRFDRNTVTDQRWIDLAPGMFEGVRICRDPGLNLAYWNLAQRQVARDAQGTWTVDGAPLVFVHLSGFDPAQPRELSAHPYRRGHAGSGLEPLLEEYAARLHEQGEARWHDHPRPFGALGDGTPVAPLMRAVFRRLWDVPGGFAAGAGTAASQLRDPRALTADDFNQPSPLVPEVAGLCVTHLMVEAWCADAQLRQRFDLQRRSGQAGLIVWFAAHATQQLQLPPALVPAAPPLARKLVRVSLGKRLARCLFDGAHAWWLELPEDRKAALRALRPDFLRTLARRMVAGDGPPPKKSGLSIFGYAGAVMGLGETVRALAHAAAAARIDFDLHDLPVQGRAAHAEPALDARRHPLPRRRAQLFCNTAADMALVPPQWQRAAQSGCYRIGYWLWELERFPAAWQAAFDEVDEVWASSPFIAAAMRAATAKPVRYMPQPVQFKLERPYARDEFGLPAEPYLFLFSCDFDSYAQRKNPRACVEAFRLAFAAARADVGLVVKVLHAQRHAREWEDLRALAAGDARIHLLDVNLPRAQAYGLSSVCDAYVSLHRSEGFGLGLAEAMLLGKPVLGTGYSGNLAFMNADNSLLVDYRLAPVEAGAYPQGEGQHWAEPDLAQAARAMARLADDRAFGAALGARAAQSIRTELSYAAIGARMRARLDELGLLA